LKCHWPYMPIGFSDPRRRALVCLSYGASTFSGSKVPEHRSSVCRLQSAGALVRPLLLLWRPRYADDPGLFSGCVRPQMVRKLRAHARQSGAMPSASGLFDASVSITSITSSPRALPLKCDWPRARCCVHRARARPVIIDQRNRCALAVAQPDSTTEPPASKNVSVASLRKLSGPVISIPCSIRCTPRTSGGVGEPAGVEN